MNNSPTHKDVGDGVNNSPTHKDVGDGVNNSPTHKDVGDGVNKTQDMSNEVIFFLQILRHQLAVLVLPQHVCAESGVHQPLCLGVGLCAWSAASVWLERVCRKILRESESRKVIDI